MGVRHRLQSALSGRIPRAAAVKVAAAALPATLVCAVALTALVRLAAAAVIGG